MILARCFDIQIRKNFFIILTFRIIFLQSINRPINAVISKSLQVFPPEYLRVLYLAQHVDIDVYKKIEFLMHLIDFFIQKKNFFTDDFFIIY